MVGVKTILGALGLFAGVSTEFASRDAGRSDVSPEQKIGARMPAHVHLVQQADCPDSTVVKTTSGLRYCVLNKGTGEQAADGMRATIHEITTLINGFVIFDSHKNNQPITFLLGGNQVIKGVEEGVTGMRVGEKRRLLVPPSLSVRASYPANTPKDSTLRIDVELVGVKRP